MTERSVGEAVVEIVANPASGSEVRGLVGRASIRPAVRGQRDGIMGAELEPSAVLF